LKKENGGGCWEEESREKWNKEKSERKNEKTKESRKK